MIIYNKSCNVISTTYPFKSVRKSAVRVEHFPSNTTVLAYPRICNALHPIRHPAQRSSNFSTLARALCRMAHGQLAIQKVIDIWVLCKALEKWSTNWACPWQTRWRCVSWAMLNNLTVMWWRTARITCMANATSNHACMLMCCWASLHCCLHILAKMWMLLHRF